MPTIRAGADWAALLYFDLKRLELRLFTNLRKRFERELQRLRADERARLATEWLPIVDNLEMALEHPGADNAALLEGVRAVHDQAVAVLARLGFDRLDEAGVPFDPARHEATASASWGRQWEALSKECGRSAFRN